jgi:hypothetical protein
MTFAQEADLWPYDGLGDENDDELPPQDGDDESDLSLDNLEDWLCNHPSGVPFFDEFVEKTLAWLHDQMDTHSLMVELKWVRTNLKQEQDDLDPRLKRALLRLKRALEADDGEIALHILMQLSDELREGFYQISS